jgi:thiol-disulfide isomerase/thioredoxin
LPKPSPINAPPSDDVSTPQQLAAAIARSEGEVAAGGGGRLVVLCFVTSFAPPCIAVLASLKKLQTAVGNVEVYTVAVDTPGGGSLADTHGVEVTPTLHLHVQGQMVHEMRTVSLDLIHPFVLKWSKKAKGGPRATKGHEV